MIRFLIVISLLTLSCQESSHEVIKLEIDISKKSNYKLSNLIDSISTVKLDSNATLGSIEKIVYSKEIFFVGDFNNTKSITLFDKLGKLRNVIKCKEKIIDFAVDPALQELYILSGRYLIAYSFPTNDEALYKLRIPFYATALEKLDKNRFCFNLHRAQSSTLHNAEFIITDEDLKLVSKYLPYDESCQDGFYSLNKAINNNNNGINVFRKFDPNIYFIKKDKLTKTIAINFGENSASHPIGTQCHEEYLKKMQQYDNEQKVLGIDNFFQYSKTLYMTYVFDNYVHALHYNLSNNKYYSYSLGDIENDLFEGDFYFTPQAKYSESEFVFVNEPVYNNTGLPDNPSLIIASFKSI